MIPSGFIATIAEFQYFPVQIRGKKRLAVPPLGLRNPTQTGLSCYFFCTHFYYVLTFYSLGHVFYVFVGYNILVLLIVHIINCCSAGEECCTHVLHQ